MTSVNILTCLPIVLTSGLVQRDTITYVNLHGLGRTLLSHSSTPSSSDTGLVDCLCYITRDSDVKPQDQDHDTVVSFISKTTSVRSA